jgi:hypothetical protein
MGERGWGSEGSERRIGLRSARTVGVEAVSGSIPQYRSGQFGLHRLDRDVPQPITQPSQSLNTDQGNSDGWLVSGKDGSALDVSIPQYRSGQFGQPPSQAQPFQDLTRPFRVTSQNHLRDPIRFPWPETRESLTTASIHAGYQIHVTSPPKRPFAAGMLLVRHDVCRPLLQFSKEARDTLNPTRNPPHLQSESRPSTAIRPKPKVAPLQTCRRQEGGTSPERLKVLPRSSPPLSRRVGGRMGERGWGSEGSERRIGLRSARTVGVEAVSGSIPQYRSGQFGRGARCHPLRLRLRVSIPQDQSGQFGPGGIMWQVIWNFWKSQYRSGQFGRQHRRNVPGPEHRVSIPQYRSGQFGQPPSQSQPFQDLTRPFRVTSQNHLREPCAFPCREFENRSQQPPFMQVIGSMLPRRQNGPLPLACFLSGTTFAGPYSGPAGWRAIDKSGVQRPLARTVVLLAWIA